jgi:hypothetical protein
MDDLQRLQANVQLVIAELGPTSGLDFGLNRESVKWVEGFIEGQRARPDFDAASPNRLVSVLGSFLGACIVAATNGNWSHEDGVWGVRFANGNVAFPFAKVDKQFRNGLGAGDSIVAFYDGAVQYVAQ